MYRSGTGIELEVSVSKFFERYPALQRVVWCTCINSTRAKAAITDLLSLCELRISLSIFISCISSPTLLFMSLSLSLSLSLTHSLTDCYLSLIWMQSDGFKCDTEVTHWLFHCAVLSSISTIWYLKEDTRDTLNFSHQIHGQCVT